MPFQLSSFVMRLDSGLSAEGRPPYTMSPLSNGTSPRPARHRNLGYPKMARIALCKSNCEWCPFKGIKEELNEHGWHQSTECRSHCRTHRDLHLHGSLLHLAEPRAFRAWLRTLFHHNWVVYAKRPVAGPEQALRYLGACPMSRRLGIPGCLLHPAQDGSLGDFVSKHLQLAVDTGGTPSVLRYHAKDELTQRLRCRFPAGIAYVCARSISSTS